MDALALHGETDPLIDEDWLEQIMKAMDMMRVEDDATRILLEIGRAHV